MVPFWGKQLCVRLALLVGLGGALVGLIWLISQGSGQASDSQATAALARPETTRPAADLPAGNQKETPPGSSGVVSEAEAVAAAEKFVRGRAIQVDRQGSDTTTLYTIHVQREDGKTSRVKVNASGSVTETTRVVAGTAAKRDRPTESKGKDIRGIVQALDADQHTITLLVREKGKEREGVYRLAAQVRVVGPKDLALSDVQRGARVRAYLGDDDRIVELKVDKQKPRDND